MKVMSLHPDTESESRCSKLKNKNLVRDQSNGTSAQSTSYPSSHPSPCSPPLFASRHLEDTT